jgi:hypothetical protein
MYPTVTVAGTTSPSNDYNAPSTNAKRKDTILSRYTEVHGQSDVQELFFGINIFQTQNAGSRLLSEHQSWS